MGRSTAPELTVAALRQAFDDSFAQPRLDLADPGDLCLVASLGTSSCAVPLAQAAACDAVEHITAVPSRQPALCGLAVVRGRLVPMFSAARLWREGADPVIAAGASRPRRWALLWRGEPALAFVFDDLLGVVRAPPESAAFVDYEGMRVPRVDLDRWARALTASAAPQLATQERP